MPPDVPLENLIRNILIIDENESAREQLSGILSELRGVDSGINDASVGTLKAAQAYMNEKRPYLIIIDPDIAPLKSVLPFIKRNRKKFPIWILNSKHPSWWNKHKNTLQKDPFGKRLETYYYLTKGRPAAQTKSHLLATLLLCQFDFGLMILEETAEHVTSGEVATVAEAHLRKMYEKGNKSVLKLLVSELGLSSDREVSAKPSKVKIAFVAMSFETDQKKRYEHYIKPALTREGFKPIMYANEHPDDLAAQSAALKDIDRCSLFIGDITNLRHSVLIEVGAALMTKIPRLLIAQRKKLKVAELPFMLKGHPVEFYTSDNNLSDRLKTALVGMRQNINAYRKAKKDVEPN